MSEPQISARNAGPDEVEPAVRLPYEPPRIQSVRLSDEAAESLT